MSNQYANANDWMYLKMEEYNGSSDRNIDCIATLTSRSDIIADPSKWIFGIVSFSASIGSSSLFWCKKEHKSSLIIK